ncbi:MAG: AAA family ATPase [Candidatus Glassbacteria bacterium]|nr:AAA family ATPase [Candidatus Glassbacteria bacterium]
MARSKSNSNADIKPRQVKISTLGRFSVEVDGNPLRFGTKTQRKPLELLKVLVALGGEGVSVESLSESLWPESDGDKAYNAFGTTLSRLRNLIGREALHLQDSRLGLDPHACRVDAREFTGLLTLASQAINAGNGKAAWEHLEGAFSLYQGPFLEGEFDPPEILSARDRLHSQFVRHVKELGEFFLQKKQTEKAISLYQKGLEVDDLCEEFYQNLMDCYRRQGRLAEGIAVYQRCRQTLQARMDVEPSPETEQVYQSLLADQKLKSSPTVAPAVSPQEPPTEAEKPISLPETPKITGERRQATVAIFALSGYGALSEKLDPEEVDGIMSRIGKEVQRIVEYHGGIVNQVVRDEIEAIFGIPSAHEDDPVRAVRAALELHEAVRRIAPRVEESIGVPLRMHTGLNSGLIVTHPQDGRYGITGDTVTTGAYLAKRAKPDEILIGAETNRLTAPFFQSEELQPLKLQGKSQTLEAYRITGESKAETRLEAAEERGFTDFIGREHELEALHANLATASEGRGQFVSVAGEAGVGKSRLLHEFRQGLDRNKITVLEGRCQSYGSDTPYLPFINALRRGLRLLEEDSPAQLLEKAVTNIRAIDEDLEPYLPLYLHLLSIQSGDYPLPKRLHGPELAAALRDALSAIFTLAANNQPMVVIFEDWHWVDEASAAALQNLLGVMATYPLLVVVLYRPDYSSTWGSPEHHTPIVLHPLERRYDESMLKAALKTDRLPEGLSELILERTGGNPFFIEEVCRALIEEGSIAVNKGAAKLLRPLEEIALPDTVQAVIQTRLDGLGPHTRETLGLASVIGREFSRSILAHISSGQSRLSADLEELKTLELIQQTRVVPEAAYLFKHVLTQEVTYNTLLLQKRKELHGIVGRAIEALYPDRIEEQSERLAHHYSVAEHWEKAAEYGKRAGEKAKGLSQYQESIDFYERSVKWLLELPESRSRQENLVDMQLELVWNFIILGRWDESLQVCQTAEPMAQELADRIRLGMIHCGIASSCIYTGDHKKAEYHYQQSFEHFESSGDELFIAIGRHWVGTSYLGPGLWKKAEPFISGALHTYEKLDSLTSFGFGFYLMAGMCGYAHAGYCLAVQGRNREAAENFAKVTSSEIQEAGNLPSKSVYLSWHGLYVALVGEDRVEAELRADQLMELAEKSDSPFQVLGVYVAKTNILMGKENYEGVRNWGEKALRTIEGKNIRSGHVGNLHYNLARAILELGDYDAAKRHYEEGQPLAEPSPHWWGPRYDFLKGLLLARALEPDYEQAETLFEQSAANDMEVGAYVPAAQTRYHLARMLARKGDVDHAREILSALKKQFKQWAIPVWEKKCQQALAEIKSG